MWNRPENPRPRGASALRRLVTCRRGTSALEFALAAPVVLLAMAGVIDFMMVYFVTSLMEGGLQDASRLGRTGFQPAAMSREDAIRARIVDATIGLIDETDLVVSTKVYPCFDAVGEPEPFIDTDPFNGVYDNGEAYTDVNGNGQWDSDMGAQGLGGPGSIVLYEVRTEWAALTPLISNFFGADGRIPLYVSVAVRNEPFGVPAPVVSGAAGAGTSGC